MRRISLILLVACTLAVPASGQTAPQQPALHYETASAPTVRSDATAAINPFDRFLMMTGTATLGASVGTGLMWGGIHVLRAYSNRDEDDDDFVFEEDESDEDVEFAIVGTAIVAVLSPWIGASYGALCMSGRPYQEWQDIGATAMFTGGVGTVAGVVLTGGFYGPITVSKVAGFILGTGVGAALGATFALHQQSSLLNFDRGDGWRFGVPVPRLNRAPDGGAAGGVSLLSLSF